MNYAMKYRILLLAILLSFSGYMMGQGVLMKTDTELKNVDQVVMEKLDNQRLLKQEIAKRSKGRPIEFAKSLRLNVAPEKKGTWEYLDNGMALWRLRIKSEGAKSLNLGFSEFYLPSGTKLVIYSLDLKTIIGPLTPADNDAHNQWWSPIIEGDELVVEAQVPYAQVKNLILRIKTVNHDYVGVTQTLSDACNLDVACGQEDGFPDVERYRDMMQAVAMYSLNGVQLCSGALINNTSEDCRPLFLTADHCRINEFNAPSMVAYFNYQNSFCRLPGSEASGMEGDGQLNQSVTGATLLANSDRTDFALVEFDDDIDPAFNPYFAGWNRGAELPQTVVGIHHPRTEEKRISFENTVDAVYQSTRNGDRNDGEENDGTANDNGNFLTIPDWDIGVTEGGSSGSPLFNQDGLIVGQLCCGLASQSCEDTMQLDIYGWINKSWEGAGTPETRLKDWLDPNGTGLLTLNGKFGKACGFASVDTASTNLQRFCNEVVGTLSYDVSMGTGLGDMVTATLTSAPDGITLGNPTEGLAFSYEEGELIPFQFFGAGSLTTGSYQMRVNLEGNNGESTALVFFVDIENNPPGIPAILQPSDGGMDITITPDFEWEEADGALSYSFQLATDPDFSNLIVDTSGLKLNFYRLPIRLDIQTTYYWRVNAENICGFGGYTPTASFTTFDQNFNGCAFIRSVDLPIVMDPAAFGTYTSTINFPFGSEDGGFNVQSVIIPKIKGLHTWHGDLTIRLTSPAGTTVTLVERLCDFDPSENYDIALADNPDVLVEGRTDFTYDDIPCPYNDGQFYQPKEALSAFNGEDAKGDWVLSVIDSVEQDGGVIQEFSLVVCTTTENLANEFKTVVSTNDEILENSVRLMPNPASSNVNLLLEGFENQEKRYSVYNLTGQLITNVRTKNDLTTVDVSDFPPGVYMVKISVQGRTATKKLIVQ